MRLLLLLAREYPWQSVIALVALTLSSLTEGLSLSLLLPLVSMAIDSRVQTDPEAAKIRSEEGGDLEEAIVGAIQSLGITPSIEVLLVAFVVTITLKSGLGIFVARQIGYTVAQVATNLRLSLLKALLATRWEHYLHQRVGRVANSMSAEAMRASVTYNYGLKLVALTLELVVYSSVALLVSWKATLVSLALGGLILLALRWLVRMSRRAGEKQTELMKSLISRLTDSLRSVKPLKAMGREDLAGAVLASETRRLNKSLQRQTLSSAALGALQAPMFAATVVTALYVALMYWHLSLAAVMVMVLLLARVLKRLGNIQKVYQSLVTSESAYWSLQSMISKAEREREPATGEEDPVFERELRLDDVQFSYEHEGNVRSVLRDVSLTIPFGSFTTIVGPSGVGKTTIVDLVSGLLRPQSGSVTIDDMPLARVHLRRWRSMIGYVPQETLLLHDTVYTNVTLGDPALSPADAKRALRAAGAWDFIAKLPQGMLTQVGEQGSKLSGGQRQRIVIARAIAHRPRLLILDEATSALDAESEAAICLTMRELRGTLTILAISHRPAFVDAADVVYRIDDGNVELVATGEEAPLKVPVA